MAIKRAQEELRKTPAEEVHKQFDFADDLATGETLVSAVITEFKRAGEAYISSSDLLIAAPTFSGSKVQVKISNGILDAEYKLNCVLTTSLQKLEGAGILRVVGT